MHRMRYVPAAVGHEKEKEVGLWRSMTLLAMFVAEHMSKWLMGTKEGMRMEKFMLNLLAPTYLYFLALLRISFSIYKVSNSDSRRQRRNGYQHQDVPRGVLHLHGCLSAR